MSLEHLTNIFPERAHIEVMIHIISLYLSVVNSAFSPKSFFLILSPFVLEIVKNGGES